MPLALLVLAVAFGLGLLSGLVGIGGGIVMAPVLLYAPAALGLAPLDMWQVTGLTVTQGLAACVAGGLRHDREGLVHRRLATWMGAALVPTALAGAVLSRSAGEGLLKGVFAALAAAAAVLMALPRPEADGGEDAAHRAFPVPTAVALAAATGFLGGLVGQAGGFLLVPLMIHVLRLPTRVVIGSNLALASLSSLAGFAGKAATGQVPWVLAAAVAAGAVPGAWLGGSWSRRLEPRSLRLILAAVLVLAAVRIARDAAR